MPVPKERRFVKWYIHQRSLIVKGHAELSLAASVFQYVVLLWLFIRDMLDIPRSSILIVAPVASILVIGIQYWIGWIWDKKKIVNEEQDWIMVRSPQIQAILKAVEKEKK